MSKPFRLITFASVFWVLSAFSSMSTFAAGTVQIPRDSRDQNRTMAPAVDLTKDGQLIDRDEAFDLLEQGYDLSRLDPASNKAWSPEPLPFSNEAELNFPPDGGTVDYDSDLTNGESDFYRTRVITDGERPFHLIAGLDEHASLVRAALLRALGYKMHSPKHFRVLTIRFTDLAARDAFLSSLGQYTRTNRARWIHAPLTDAPEVTLHDVILQSPQLQPQPYHLGILHGSKIAGKRALRALIVPFVLLDIGESINLFPWEVGSIQDQTVVLNHKYATSFVETTFDDARWITRKLARLTRDDWKKIVERGAYPEEIAAAVLEKVIARRNQLLELFRIKDELPSELREFRYNPKITIGENVKDGKVLKETYEGYALRFRHDVPETPLNKYELARYLRTETVTAGIKALTKQINEKLDIQNGSDVATQHQGDLVQEFMNHLRQHPTEPFVKSLGTWVGPTGGFGINASRNIMSGTYYGSDSSLQLVDTISAQASLGFFMGFDGVPSNTIPTVSGNLTVLRNYVHVQPLEKAKKKKDDSEQKDPETDEDTPRAKSPWKNLWIPGFMRTLGKMLEPEPPCKAPDDPFTVDPATGEPRLPDSVPVCPKGVPADALKPEEITKNLQAFFDEFRENEVLTVTDSVGLGVGGSVTIPISALVGAPVGVPGAFTIGTNGQGIITKRTTFTRTKHGLQIYVQSMKTGSQSFTFDFSFWMKILRSSYTMKGGMSTARAYILGDMPSKLEEQRKMLIALKTLLKSNDNEVVEDSYHPYILKHEVPSDAFRLKFLRWQYSAISEGHQVKIRPPEDPEGRYKAEEKERTLYSHRIVRRTGTNDYSFLSDILDGATSGYGFDSGGSGDNPANSFLGTSKWSNTSTEAEITHQAESEPVTISEHHWQGWLLSRDKLFRVFDQIEAKIRSLNNGVPLIQRDEFNDLKQLQMYSIRSTLVVYEDGVKKIRDELFTQLRTSDRALFQFLVELEGRAGFESWCRAEVTRNWTRGDFADYDDVTRIVKDIIDGDGWFYACLKPWMSKVLKLAKTYPSAADERIRWTNQLIFTLEKAIPFDRLLKWIGKDHYFFYVQLSGFRSGQDNADAEYVSSSLGTVNPKHGVGIFRQFLEKYPITAYELYGRYLSEGQ